MSKLISLALIIVILTTLAIAEPNQPETTEVQQGSNSVPAAGNQQAEPDQLEIYNLLDNKIIELEKHIRQTKEEIDKKFDYHMRCNDAAINSVNTSISGASYALMIFGIIVTFLGVGLGIYIARQVSNVTQIAKQSKTVLVNHLKIRDEVRSLDEDIKNNMSKLYNDLKEEETRALIKRLNEVPEDIGNLFPILASREIQKEFFPQIKKAFQALSGSATGDERKYSYLGLFFQHFAGLAIFDDDLHDKMESNYLNLMQFSFENDIMNTSEDFVKVIIKEGDILDFTEKIKKYFIAMQQSKFKNRSELHRHIYKSLLTKENRFALYSILQQEEQLKDMAKIYGQHLLSDYKNARNSEAENKMLIDITEAIETKKEDNKPKPQK